MSKIFNNALFEAKERESAVSPVVGVMLMLVVTIIIAATVSAFAGGLVGTADKAPQAAFDTKITAGAYGAEMSITHLGGDPIDTARVKIITSWTNKTMPDVVYYRETTALPYSSTPSVYNTGTGKTVNLSLADANCNYTSYGTTYKYQEPYFVIPGIMPTADDPKADGGAMWFGNFVLHTGEVMKVQTSTGSWNDAGYKDHSVIKDALLLSGKDVVNVKFVDIPTGQIIFDKDIYVTEA